MSQAHYSLGLKHVCSVWKRFSCVKCVNGKRDVFGMNSSPVNTDRHSSILVKKES